MSVPNQFYENVVDLTAAHPPDEPLAALQQPAPVGNKGVPTISALPPEADEDGTAPSSQRSRKKKVKSNRTRISLDESELLLDQAERDFLGTPPKRPFTAYNAYFTVARRNWLNRHPKCDEDRSQKRSNRFLQMSKDIINDWKNLSEEEKAPYVAKSNVARAQYQIDLKEYKQRCRQLRRKQASDSKGRDTQAPVADKQGDDMQKASKARASKARTSKAHASKARTPKARTPMAPRRTSQNNPASTTCVNDSTNAPPATARPLSVPSKVESAATQQTLSTPSSSMAPQAPAPQAPAPQAPAPHAPAPRARAPRAPAPVQASLLHQQQQQLLLSQAALAPFGGLAGGLAGGMVAPPLVSLNPLLLQEYNLQQQLALQAQLSQIARQPIVATVDPLTGMLSPAVGLMQNHAAATLGIQQPIVVLPSAAATTPVPPPTLSAPLSSALDLQRL